MEFKVKQMGIGDLLILAMHLYSMESQEIGIYFCEATIKTYKGPGSTYSTFGLELLQKLLPNKRIIRSTNLKAQDAPKPEGSFNKDCLKPEVREHFKSLFHSSDLPEFKDCIILNTKVRQYPRTIFNKLKPELFSVLNNSGRKIILMGERDIAMTTEYQHHGPDNIYSIYSEVKAGLLDENVVDLTFDKFDSNSLSTESIFKDMNIISNSHRMIQIGGGGFFCLGLMTEKMTALHSADMLRFVKPEIGKQCFDNLQDFFRVIREQVESPSS